MKKFVNKFLIFVSPFIIFIIFLLLIDVYKVFGSYDNYYDNSFIELNREMVTTRTYSNYRKKEKFNSFIFGSSRSQAFKCEEWIKYLDKNTRPFHFDAHGEGIYGIAKKVEYIDKLGDSIGNALLILDRTILNTTVNRNKKHLSISPYELSGESKFKYYFTFLKAQINYNFLIAYIDYSIFKTHRDYMDGIINKKKYQNKINIENCDIWYGNDQDIKIDSIGYYKTLIDKGVFYNRPVEKKWKCEITDLEISQLKLIKEIFNSHNTNYKIVISPVYDQIPMEKEQLDLLINIFDEENIFNFSGKNDFSESITNFYEDSHYRPVVANEILKAIYSKTKFK